MKTKVEPTVETKEPSEDGSLVKVREVQPDYTSYYEVRGHGLRIHLVDKFGVMVGSRYMTKSDLDTIQAHSVQEAKADERRRIFEEARKITLRNSNEHAQFTNIHVWGNEIADLLSTLNTKEKV